MNLTFTTEDLRTFFQKNKDQPVGRACDDYQCPIATYFLREREKAVRVQVDRICTGSFLVGNFRERPLELWQKDFVQAFDIRFGDEGPITGQEALDILDEVTVQNREEKGA